MYGHNRNTGIRRIMRYEEALNRLNNTKPIAGNGVNAGVIPLGHRNRSQFQLRMRQDESIACKLWRTDVVVFDKDGTITLDFGGYSTISTASFISEVLGVSVRQYDNRLIVSIADKEYEAEGLKLRHVVGGWNQSYEVLECKTTTVHSLDRKGMNALRKDTQEFRKFLSGLMKIKGNEITDEELNEINLRDNGALTLDLWRCDVSHKVERFKEFMGLVKSGDAENWHKGAMWLCASSRQYSTRRFEPRLAMKRLDELQIALNPTVLVAKQVELGAIKVDAYAKFKPFVEEYWK